MKKKYTPLEVAEFYNSIPVDLYEHLNLNDTLQAASADQIETLHKHIIDVAGLKENMKILDCGCGIGGPSIYFAKNLNASIEAVNISEVQVGLFRSKIIANGLENKINVTNGDFHLLDQYYSEQTFDAVLFLESFGHGSDPDLILKAVHKVLKQDGVLLIKEPVILTSYSPIKNWKIRRIANKMATHYKYHPKTFKKIQKLLKNNTFKIGKINIPHSNELNFDRSDLYEELYKANIQVFKKVVEFSRTYEILCMKGS